MKSRHNGTKACGHKGHNAAAALRSLCTLLISVLMTAPLAAAGAAGQSSIVNGPHNLSASSTGTVHAASEEQICIFCHTPHNASPIEPLWNRNLPISAYRLYSSNSLQAKPKQPTGSSKLCLSCHDGTIALGSVLSRSQPIQMARGITTLPPGKSNLGTDLSDDHPISFTYDTALVTKNPKLKDPSLLPPTVKLDYNHEMQCTSCHEPHNNQYGKFLVMDSRNSQLCNSCHIMGTTTVADHVQCASCHQQHSAPSGPYLLRAAKISDTCLMCHNGGATPPQGPDVAEDLKKLAIHDMSSPINIADPFPSNVTCADCHAPHTMTTATVTVAPTVPGRFGLVSGVTSAGAAVVTAKYEYEVCFKCHADKSAVAPAISRQIVQTNFRLKMDSGAISFHPVEAPGRNRNIPSLLPGLTTASIIYCNDCHNSDSGHKAGGSGPDGVHGSANKPLLIARYDTIDNTTESAAAYALCYRCHDRNSILSDRSFPRHHTHITDKNAPCSVCHDSHGIASTQGTTTRNSHLINFDLKVVTPDTRTGRLEYNSNGTYRGACWLNCHGRNHSGTSY